MAKASYVAGFVLAALFFIGGIQLCASTNSTSAACIQPDRNALLMFKASLQDPSNLLSSWEGQDCCHWKGVTCDQNTGHVIKLHLSKSYSDPLCWDLSPLNISDGQLGLGNISLMELKHLRYLDLSGNNFQYSEIPKFFGSLNKLRYLNLSCTYFNGKVPHQLGNLTGLQVLDLRGFFGAYADNFQWASSLLSLQHLDMSGVDLGSAHNLMEVLTRLPSLQNLQLSDCGINNTHFQHALLNSTFIASIQFLDLSHNELQTPILSALQNMSFLRVLDISENSFNSSVPLWLGNLKSLVTLNLGWSEFYSIEGGLSSLINNYCHLKSLDLSGNRFHEEAFGTGQKLNMAKASYVAGFLLAALFFIGGIQLCASTNSTSAACIQPDREALLKFKASLQDPSNLLSSWEGQDCCHWKGVTCDQNTGHVIKLHLRKSYSDPWCEDSSPSNISEGQLGLGNISLMELKHLRYLDLSGNNFQDSKIPKFFGSLNKLRHLNLSFTCFSGKVPHQLGNLSNLQVLDLEGYSQRPYVDNFQWASSLLSLQHLDMSGVDLGSAHNLMEVLTRLPSLQNLQLSECGINNTHFQHALLNSTFIASIQNMSFLRVLDISDNSFNSSVPLWLGNLKSLVTLNLGWNEFDSIEGGLSSLINNYCHLKSLDLSANRFHGEAFGTGQNLSRCVMHSLESLSLGDNQIGGQFPNWLAQLRGLQHLDLNYNQLSGVIPNTLQNMSFLRVLDISQNSFNSSVPLWLGNLKSLVTLDLAQNEFDSIEGGLSSLINNYCHLKSLDISGNRFHGEAFGTGQNLSGCVMHSLESLSLVENDIGWQLPNWLGQLRGLKHLDLSNSSLHGPIPSSLWNLSNLRVLSLYDNQLSGVIPKSLGQLVNLEEFSVHTNSLEGTLSEIHFSNLSMLKLLAIGDNYNLSFKVSSDWIPPFSLQGINMENCKIEGSKFPPWLHTQEEVSYLSLKNASISGIFPMWLQSMPLSYLDLFLNQISGPLPSNFGDGIYSLYLSNNRINGSIPNSLCGLNDLRLLDLSRNMLHGQIPDCWADSLNIDFIDLSSNKLSGTIPVSIGNLPSLNWLLVNNNSLSGKLPLALINCSSLISLDLGENNLSGIIPTWIGEKFWYLEILRLRKNVFTGTIPLSLCRLSRLRILDLGYNSLMGRIPFCFSNLSGMIMIHSLNYETSYYEVVMEVMKGQLLEYTRSVLHLVGLRGLNLSHNNLSGSIPRNIGNITSLESLDLSDNQLSGTIPNSMSFQTSLSYLNLSHNKLSGKIPKGNQLQTLTDPSIYAGNQLCGDPLPNKCPGDEEHVPPPMSIEPENEEHGESKSEKFWFYFVVSCGYATGLWGVIGILIVKKNWRIAYFQNADKAKDWVLMMGAVQVARLKRKMERNNNGSV